MSNSYPPAFWFPLLSSLALGSCSSPTVPAATTTPATTSSHQPRTPGTAVDSLDGLPGHHFGEPLSAFPGLVKTERSPPGQQGYLWPRANPHQPAWFAKHRAQVPGVFYYFQRGRFAGFQAIAYSPAGQAALEQEARYLFGPGRELGLRTEWAGKKAWATLTASYLNAQSIKMLEVRSYTLAAEQAREDQVRLQAENAP